MQKRSGISWSEPSPLGIRNTEAMLLSTPFSSSSKITRFKVKSFALTLSSCIPPFLDRSPFREKVAET